MKTLMCTFNIAKVGGIITVKDNLKKGLQSLGHTVTDAFISLNTKTLTKPDGFDTVLGFRSPEFRSSFSKCASDHDLLIFTHPCPTITKAYSDPSWMNCYKTGKPNIVITHDPFYSDYYPWFKEVYFTQEQE